MSGSRKPGPLRPPVDSGIIPARTPGSLGINDQGDVMVTTALGDTPSPLGIRDWADPTLPQFCAEKPYAELICKSKDGTPLSIGLGDQTLAPARIDKTAFVNFMKENAEEQATGKCARYVRKALEAGGLDTTDRPGEAKDYGPFLKNHGALVISQSNYTPKVGDVAVFDGNESHPHGHVQVFDGEKWISDFTQSHFLPYSQDAPPSTIYRLP